MIFFKRGELQWKYLIGILLSVIIIIMMIYKISNLLVLGYDTSVMECNYFMKNVKGSPNYFGDGLDEVNYRFENTVGNLCPFKDVKASENDLLELANVVNGCYKQMGAGADYFGANVEEESVCFQCGFVRLDSDVDDFNSRFYEVLSRDKYKGLWFNETDLINTNFVTLDEDVLPKSMVKNDLYMILYYAYRPDSGNFYDSVSAFFGKYINVGAGYFFLNNNEGGFSGVVLEKWSDNVNFETDRNVSFYKGGTNIGCDRVIISKQIYD